MALHHHKFNDYEALGREKKFCCFESSSCKRFSEDKVVFIDLDREIQNYKTAFDFHSSMIAIFLNYKT